MELRGYRRVKKPIFGFFRRHYYKGRDPPWQETGPLLFLTGITGRYRARTAPR